MPVRVLVLVGTAGDREQDLPAACLDGGKRSQQVRGENVALCPVVPVPELAVRLAERADGDPAGKDGRLEQAAGGVERGRVVAARSGEENKRKDDRASDRRRKEPAPSDGIGCGVDCQDEPRLVEPVVRARGMTAGAGSSRRR